ncbi:ATP-binding protein, partial [Streptomyces platensis]|uniref:ATP-binding protein n=1 Tax=Streptomyces platensis TaxID=58346 RepID=UPI001F2304BC
MLEPPTPATWRIALPRGATAVPIARAMVRTAMQDLRVTADRTTAQLLTAELVTNALKHTCGAAPIELVVEQRPSGCRIEVHDDGPLLVKGL